MRDEELDELLKKTEQLNQPMENSSEAPIDEGVLLAYRAQKLSPDEAEAVERRLVRDPEARALLRELSQEVSSAEVDRVVQVVPSNVIPLGSRRRRIVTWTVTTLAAAAGLTVILSLRAPQHAAYVMEVEGGTSTTRGAERPDLVLTGDARLVVRLRAERPTTEPRVLGVFAEGDQGRLRRLAVESAHRQGSFETVLTRANLGLPAGQHRLWLLVATSAEALVDANGQTQRAASDVGLGWHGLDVEVRLE